MARVTIALGIPVYNDKEFIAGSIQNALDVGYDHVVYLDDGSTDGSYGLLKEYAKKYDHIHVYRNKINSVNNKRSNRWYDVARKCKQFDTDWIGVRACDERLSYKAFKNGQDLLNKRLMELSDTANLVGLARIDLWRSEYWYRADGFWGQGLDMEKNFSFWNNRKKWDWNKDRRKAGFHAGGYHPDYFYGDKVVRPLNLKGNKDIVILHYGLSSHDRIANTLDYQMKTADIFKGGVNIVETKDAPPIEDWKELNGYKVAHEFGMVLKPIQPEWRKYKMPALRAPRVESLYPTIAKYNKERAIEYKKLFEKEFGK